MTHQRSYCVYILGNFSGVLYVEVTNDITRRVYEHKKHLIPGFTHRYRVTRLLYVEESADIRAAIAREKQIKAWNRAKKDALINTQNPARVDLAADWVQSPTRDRSRRKGSPNGSHTPGLTPPQ